MEFSELISHSKTLCSGLHALDVLALKNEIQHYHMDMEGIPEYTNTLEDAQKQSKIAGNSIVADTLLIIASNFMLLRECFPQADESCEDLNKGKTDWAAWKNLYKASDRKTKVKKQAVAASVASFIKANKQLSCWVGNHRNINNRSCKDYPAPHPKTLCPHCNIKVMHAPDNCFEL